MFLFNAILSGIGLSLQVYISFRLVRYRLYRRFFWFLAYILYVFVESIVRLSVLRLADGYGRLYYNVYWWTELGEVLMGALAVRESFYNVFRDYYRLRWFVWSLWGSVGLALSYAVAKAVFSPPVAATFRGALIIGLKVAANYSLTAVGLVYLLMLLLLRVQGHQWESGIIAGFTVYCGMGVFGVLLFSRFGTKYGIANWISPVVYILTEIQWALVLSLAERMANVLPSDVVKRYSLGEFTRLTEYIKILKRFLGTKQ